MRKSNDMKDRYVPIVFTDTYDNIMDQFNRIDNTFRVEIGNEEYRQWLVVSSLQNGVQLLIISILSLVVNELGIHTDYYDNLKDYIIYIPDECKLINNREIRSLYRIYYSKYNKPMDLYSYKECAGDREIDIAEDVMYLFDMTKRIRKRIENNGGPIYSSKLSMKNDPFNISNYIESIFRDGHSKRRYRLMPIVSYKYDVLEIGDEPKMLNVKTYIEQANKENDEVERVQRVW